MLVLSGEGQRRIFPASSSGARDGERRNSDARDGERRTSDARDGARRSFRASKGISRARDPAQLRSDAVAQTARESARYVRERGRFVPSSCERLAKPFFVSVRISNTTLSDEWMGTPPKSNPRRSSLKLDPRSAGDSTFAFCFYPVCVSCATCWDAVFRLCAAVRVVSGLGMRSTPASPSGT